MGSRVGVVGAVCAAIAVAGQAASASPITLGFTAIENNNAGDAAIGEDQMRVVITDEGSNTVSFQFFNDGPDQSTITSIYFDDDVPVLDATTVVTSYSDPGGMSFSSPATPGNLPGGNDPAIQFTATNSQGAGPPPPQNGVNPGEWVSFLFDFVGSLTFADLAAAIAADPAEFRMGLHVTNYASGGSESFVNGPPIPPPPNQTPIPEPASILLMGIGAVGLGGYARRRARKKDESAAA